MQRGYRAKLTEPVIMMVLALVLALAVACGGDERAEEPSVVVGDRDASVPVAPPPATQPDGGDDGLQRIADGERVLCTHDEDDLFGFGLEGLEASTALAGDRGGFAMLYGSDPGDLLLRAVSFREPAEDAVLVAGGAIDAASPLIGVSDERFLVVYRSAADDRLFARVLDSAGAEPQLLAEQIAIDGEGGVLASVVGVQGGFVVTWVEREGAVQLLRLGLDGQVEASERLGALAPTIRHLRVGQFSDGRLLVAWSQDGESGDIVVMGQVYDAELTPEQTATRLSGEAPASTSRFELAVFGDSAGIVYPALEGGAREVLKFRRIDRDGTVSGPLLNIVNAPRRSVDGAIAAFGQGYVVSYRLLPSAGEPEERIEVAFVNQFGAIVYRGSLGPSSAEGGPTSVAATPSGHVLAAWNAATTAGGAEVRAAKLYCPGALLLCGGDLQ